MNSHITVLSIDGYYGFNHHVLDRLHISYSPFLAFAAPQRIRVLPLLLEYATPRHSRVIMLSLKAVSCQVVIIDQGLQRLSLTLCSN